MSNIREVKIRKLFNSESGKVVIIPIDHGFYMGAVKGLEDPVSVLKRLIKDGVDGTLMSFGLGKITADLFNSKNSMTKILTADYVLMSKIPGVVEGIFGNSIYSTLEQAIKWEFDAVKVLLVWGTESDIQLEAIKYIGELARECDKLDMPLMIEPVLLGKYISEDKKKDPKVIKDACRIAVELGADILKAPYTGDKESFSEIIKNSHIPVVILGGPRMGSIKDVMQTAKDSIDAGGKGVVFGRNVWQNPDMDKVIYALKDIVHKNSEVDEVLNKYNLK
jgi:DhnA family fructose-bisphosphate aldolase class Ia